MKSKSLAVVFIPVAVVLIGSGLMVLDGVIPGILPTWVLWQLVLFAAISMCIVVAAMCAIWVVQWCIRQAVQRSGQAAQSKTNEQYPEQLLHHSQERDHFKGQEHGAIKSKSFTVIAASVAITLIGSGLMVMDGVDLNIIPTWVLWQVVLFAAATVCIAVAVIFTVWLVQWCMERLMQRSGRIEKNRATVLQYHPKSSAPVQPVKVDYLSAMNE